MDMFPFKAHSQEQLPGWAAVLVGVLLVFANALLWFFAAFVIAWGAHTGWNL